MGKRKIHKNQLFPNLMKRLGLIPEDNEFNRRAAAYAKSAMAASYYQKRKQPVKPNPEKGRKLCVD